MNDKKNNCVWWKKFDWKFWVLIVTVLLSLYKTVLLSDNHIKTLQKVVEGISIEVKKNSLTIARIDERTKYLQPK